MFNNRVYGVKPMKMSVVALAFVIGLAIATLWTDNVQAAESTSSGLPEYSISASSIPCNKAYLSYSTYNAYTKHYFVIRSYVELLQKQGGGTLRFKKGYYWLPINVFIPSNITFVFEDGVYIKKTAGTGSKSIRHSDNLFQFVSMAQSKIAGSVGGYGGSRNIVLRAEGTATIDMGAHENGCALIIGHNSNVKIYGIKFTNADGHFIELDASKKVVIENCSFSNIKGTTTEAINIDTPDPNTGGFGFSWSKLDKTPNDNVLIKKCVFTNVPRAIGTHKYSTDTAGSQIYHNNIRIIYCIGSDIANFSIRPLNWSNSLIAVNDFSGPGPEKYCYYMLAGGISNLTIRDNIIRNYTRAIAIRPAKNGGAGSEYPATYNNLTAANIEALSSNQCESATVHDRYARINETLDLSDKAQLISLLSF